ncbi:Ltp family lipoprotein [Pediococcus pentosaceus]|uniref:Ltp family lipoprotein n=1 Tax=Pediococcus pentosaceus TaxID=1255 RepID=UPI002073B413|nr:Ltp family lipoprotein [Pediococcus pentosaceus]MCM6817739.1 Ltp family lipoprotein [Pediococcus pentosaceus]
MKDKKFCFKCGKEIESDAEFCPYCGAKQLNKNDSNTINGKDSSKNHISNDLNKSKIVETENSKKKWYKKWWIWVIVLIFICIVWSLGSSNSSSSSSVPNNNLTFKNIIKIDSKKSDSGGFDTDENGSFTLRGKALKNVTITLKDDLDSDYPVKTKKLKAGQTFSFPLNVKKSEDLLSLNLHAKYSNKNFEKDIDVYNENAYNNSSDGSSDSSSDDIDSDNSSSSSSSAKVSTEFKNALETAKSYSDSMHMSKAGIYEQLTSTDGEGFPADAAQYAVDNLKADYNKNALETAETYSKDMHMSTQEIRDQLTSNDGEQFTESEADYAIQHLGN